MNCPNCGTPNEPGATFCGRCGTPLSQPAPADETKRSRTPVVIAVVVVAALLALCCCCLVAGGGLTVLGPTLIPQASAVPSRVPAPSVVVRETVVVQTPAPTVAPAPTAPPLPTRPPVAVTPVLPSPTPPTANTPASSPIASSETTKTYENTSLGFSIQYPDNWTIEEEQDVTVTFLHPEGQLRVLVGVSRNVTWASGEAANTDLIESTFKKNGSVEGLATSTLDFAGATWAISEFRHVQGDQTNRAAVFSTVRDATLYTIVDYGPAEVYGREVSAMAKMALSFKFLTPAGATPTPTPTPTTAAAGIYRATVATKTGAGQPFIRGRVLNSSGRAISGAVVELYNTEKHWILSVGTGTDGRYEMTVSAGSYYMKLKNHNSAWSPLVTVKWGQEATVDWKEQ